MKDPYLYVDSDILINKHNIKDKEKLDELENRLSNLALVKIFKQRLPINSVFDIFTIHKMMFENVYEWAGKPRTINIFKQEPILNGLSVNYSAHKSIMRDFKTIDELYLNQDLKKLDKQDYIHVFTRLIAEIWKVHPFREGNTRTVSAFAFLLLTQNGYKYNAEIIQKNAKFFRNALVMASLGEYAEYNYLQTILMDVIEGKSDDSGEKYKKIKQYEVDNYEYEYHKIKVDSK